MKAQSIVFYATFKRPSHHQPWTKKFVVDGRELWVRAAPSKENCETALFRPHGSEDEIVLNSIDLP